MKKLCVVTGTRAEYGLLKPLLHKIKVDKDLELQLVVTGAHLSPEFGLTYQEIVDDGFEIRERVEILLSSDTSVGITKSMGLTMIGFAETYERLVPDLLILLGDRYEIFAAASAAVVAMIPIAHISGGDVTEGAIDEAFRHSITKMSHLHFTTTESYRQRVIQLGEDPGRVFNVGALGVESALNLELLNQEDLEREIGFSFVRPTAMVTFHPVTLEGGTAQEQFQELLDALDEFPDLKVIFTKANADTDGRVINQMIDEYVLNNSTRAVAYTSLGQLRYLSSLQYVDMVIGNSSSGIIEAPSFKIPTINIGDRQKGRIQAESIINCESNKQEIIRAIDVSMDSKIKREIESIENPYSQDDTSGKIIAKIKENLPTLNKCLKKKFYDI